MKKIILIAVALAAFVNCVYANEKPMKNPPRRTQKFDWKKAAGERKKMWEKHRAEYKLHIEKLKEFHKRYSEAPDENAKNAIKKELEDFLAKDFQRKIDLSKKRVEGMKKFVARLEEDQKKMEAKAPEFVKKRTEEVLQGKISRPRPRKK